MKHLGSCIDDGAEMKPKRNTLKGRGFNSIIKSFDPNFLLAMLRADVVMCLGKKKQLSGKVIFALCLFSYSSLEQYPDLSFLI